MNHAPRDHRPAYRALYFANFVTAMGMLCFLPFLPFHIQQLGVTDDDALKVWTGFVVGAAPLTSALVGPLWGALGDRIGRRLMILRALLAITIFVGAMGFAASVWQLFILRICQGLFSGFVAPSMTLVTLYATEDRQTRAVAGVQGAMVLGACVGPGLGAALSEFFGVRTVYLTCSCLALASAFVVWRFVEEPATPRQDPGKGLRGSLASIFIGLGAMLRAPSFLWILVGAACVRLAVKSIEPMIAIFVTQELAVDPAWESRTVGLAYTALGIVTAISLPIWGRVGDGPNPIRVLAVCCFATGLLLMPQALVWQTWLWILLLSGTAAFASGIMPLTFGIVARLTSPTERGGGIGLTFLALNLALAMGPILGGAISRALHSVRPLYVIAGTLCILSSLGLMRLAMRTNDQSRADSK